MSLWPQIEEVLKQAHEREVKQAYLRLARELHPDKAGTPEEARANSESLAVLSKTYNALKAPETRADASQEEKLAAWELLETVAAQGVVRRTQTSMVGLSDAAIAAFYAGLANIQGPTRSPVASKPNSAWMATADFCFVNVRATGTQGRFGTFVHAAKLLPALRANAIHLGPFTGYDHQCIYAPTSVLSIAPQVVDARLDAAGIGPEMQLRAFVEAAHRLGKVVGFDLEPHLAQFSRPAMMEPRIVRWLAPDSARRVEGGSQEAQLSAAAQDAIAARVADIVQTRLQREGIADLEWAEGDDAAARSRKDQVFFGLIGELIGHGLWTLPSQVWCGDGVPAFAGYNHAGNYPQFTYLDHEGVDRSAWAYHIATPYRLYDGLMPNRRPQAEELTRNEPGQAFFQGIFAHWRDKFGFDFVRYDSVDHVVDSTLDGVLPTSDRPTPRDLAEAVAASRAGAPWIGNLAERMGTEVEDYAAMGFDAMLGDDMIRPTDAAWAADALRLTERLRAVSAGRPVPFTVVYATDTHDTGNPYLGGAPLVVRAGDSGMRRRHFLARFFPGTVRRPKYECMGTADLSHGLFASNVTEASLQWVGDEDHSGFHHFLEDIHVAIQKARPVWMRSSTQVETSPAHWAFRLSDGGMLLAAVALDGHVPAPLRVEVGAWFGEGAALEAQHYCFDGRPSWAERLEGRWLELAPLEPLGFALVKIKVLA